jgi:hypothetical protein
MTYVSDKIRGFSHEAGNHKAADEGGDWNFHNANLFDLDEDIYGNKIDYTTGRPIDNSTDNGLGGLAVREIRQGKNGDILGDLPKSKTDELADRWLKEHDPSWSE